MVIASPGDLHVLYEGWWCCAHLILGQTKVPGVFGIDAGLPSELVAEVEQTPDRAAPSTAGISFWRLKPLPSRYLAK